MGFFKAVINLRNLYRTLNFFKYLLEVCHPCTLEVVMSVSGSITSSVQSQISRICRSWYACCWALTCAGVSLGMRRTISAFTSSALAASGLAVSDLSASGLLAEAEDGAAVSPAGTAEGCFGISHFLLPFPQKHGFVILAPTKKVGHPSSNDRVARGQFSEATVRPGDARYRLGLVMRVLNVNVKDTLYFSLREIFSEICSADKLQSAGKKKREKDEN